jgi:hypothetical protein
MYCRICGKTGGGSENPLKTLVCGHSFHEECLPFHNCPICANKDTNCAICMDPMKENEDVTLLDGCMHMFHSSCIIPYFRQTDSQGKCPMCRRNPSLIEDDEASDEDEASSDDMSEAWKAIKQIQQLEERQVPKKQKKKIDSGVKAAREAWQSSMASRKKEQSRRIYSKKKEEDQKRKVKQLKGEINKVDRLDMRQRNSFRRKKFYARQKKILLGSKANPQWQYLKADGEWSENIDRGSIYKLAEEGIIMDDTLIHHPLLPEENMKWEKIKRLIDI